MLLAIDPGPEYSGWAILDWLRISPTSPYSPTSPKVQGAGRMDNGELLDLVGTAPTVRCVADRCVVEMIEGRGMPVGKSVFETCVWIGRIWQKWHDSTGQDIVRLYRREVKMNLCGSVRAKDSNVRQAIIDRYPATGGGKTPQIGLKAEPGPLYGVARDAWAAIGVGLTFLDTAQCR